MKDLEKRALLIIILASATTLFLNYPVNNSGQKEALKKENVLNSGQKQSSKKDILNCKPPADNKDFLNDLSMLSDSLDRNQNINECLFVSCGGFF